MKILNLDAKIWLALKSRMDTWTETDIYYADGVFSPRANMPYVFVQYVPLTRSAQSAIGNNCGNEFRGILQLSVFVPIGQGYNLAVHAGLRGRLADHFTSGTVMTYDDATVRVADRPQPLGNVQPNPPWNRLELQVPWRCFG